LFDDSKEERRIKSKSTQNGYFVLEFEAEVNKQMGA
jgi:hypothetical protein